MKRRLVLILMLLVGGAIVNVAVAWGCAALGPPHHSRTFTGAVDPIATYARYCPPERLDAASSASGLSEIHGPGAITYQIGNCWKTGAAYCTVEESRFGWPTKGLRSGLFQSAAYPAVSNALSSARLLRSEMLWIDETRDRYFPLGPIWPGFAINTVFYAAILWLLLAGPFVLRRRMRIKRGLCPKCAYDLRGSASATACPKCGAVRVAKPQRGASTSAQGEALGVDHDTTPKP